MQSRAHSVIEAVANTGLGFLISMVATVFILPAFGLAPTLTQSAGITACFTVVSVARQYVLRRVFNGLRS